MKKSASFRSVSTRVPEAWIEKIQASGETLSEWLRRAVECRFKREVAFATALDQPEIRVLQVRSEVVALREAGQEVQRGLGTLDRADLKTQVTLEAIQKQLAALRMPWRSWWTVVSGTPWKKRNPKTLWSCFPRCPSTSARACKGTR